MTNKVAAKQLDGMTREKMKEARQAVVNLLNVWEGDPLIVTTILCKMERAFQALAEHGLDEQKLKARWEMHWDDQTEEERYIYGSCTESNCRLCHTSRWERKLGDLHAGIGYRSATFDALRKSK